MEIQEAAALICKYSDISWSQIIKQDRKKQVVFDRHMFCYIMHKHFGFGWVAIAAILHEENRPKRNHASVINAYKKCEDLIDTDFEYRQLYNMRMSTISQVVKALPHTDKKNPKTVYLSGKISGLDFREVSATFERYEQKYIGLGYRVMNPLKFNHGKAAEWQDYMKLDIRVLTLCDIIVMLPNWSGSRGAKLERLIANELNIKAIYEAEIINELPLEV